MSTLYIRLPSKAAADSAPHWIALACPFALASHGEAIEREGALPLSDLTDMIARAQRVVLLLAASDVTLLRMQVPPLPAAKLKAALPHLVEDQLMSDPAECLVVPGATVDGLRTIAVVNRGWFEIVVKTVQTLGARHIVAVPAQLCLPYQAGAVSAAAVAQDGEVDLTVRFSDQTGLGLPIVPEQPATAAHEVVQTLCTVVSDAPITLYVAQASVPAFQDAVDAILIMEQRITVYADNWSRWIAGIGGIPLNLMAGTQAGAGPRTDWRKWRWPLALTAAVLLVNMIGLNMDWWRMKRETDTLRATMMQTYRSAFPQETVIVDPRAQMRQKLAAVQHDAGQAAPDDFTALAAGFGEAWDSITQEGRKMPAIATLEYRERALWVRLQGDAAMPPTDQFKAALAAHNLSLSQPAPDVWQIRSNK